jgi:hypothetical protein
MDNPEALAAIAAGGAPFSPQIIKQLYAALMDSRLSILSILYARPCFKMQSAAMSAVTTYPVAGG